MSFKVLTYNIHKGLSWNNKKLVLEKIKVIIHLNQADLVFLQEVVGMNEDYIEKFPEYPDQSQYEFLADTIWSEYAYAKNAIYEKRHHGNVILSKFPIEEVYIEDISTNKLEQRGVLYCKVNIPDAKRVIHCFCVHLNLLHLSRKKQYKMIDELIISKCTETDPLILAGDFNDWGMKANAFIKLDLIDTYKYLHGCYSKTFPAVFPLLSLDRIYTRNLNIIKSEIVKESKSSDLSDHLALSAELSFYK